MITKTMLFMVTIQAAWCARIYTIQNCYKFCYIHQGLNNSVTVTLEISRILVISGDAWFREFNCENVYFYLLPILLN